MSKNENKSHWLQPPVPLQPPLWFSHFTAKLLKNSLHALLCSSTDSSLLNPLQFRFSVTPTPSLAHFSHVSDNLLIAQFSEDILVLCSLILLLQQHHWPSHRLNRLSFLMPLHPDIFSWTAWIPGCRPNFKSPASVTLYVNPQKTVSDKTRSTPAPAPPTNLTISNSIQCEIQQIVRQVCPILVLGL